MRNAGLEEAQSGIKVSGRNTNNLRSAVYVTVMGESKEEERESLLMKVKEQSEKAGLQLTLSSENRIMASGPSLHGKEVGKQWKQ